jgi:hypothetical protein
MIMRMVDKIKQAPMVTTLLVIAPMLGAVTTIYNFGKIWDHLGLPRLAWLHEVVQVSEQMQDVNRRVWELELDYRRNQIKLDQRALRELVKQIIHMQELSQQVPDHVSEYKDLLENQIAEHRVRIQVIQQQLQIKP